MIRLLTLIISVISISFYGQTLPKSILDYQEEWNNSQKHTVKKVSPSTNELDKKNGFQDIKLGNNINQYDIKRDYSLGSEMDKAFGFKSYDLSKPYYIGDVQVEVSVQTTLTGVINHINVKLPAGFSMVNNLIKSYGKPSVSGYYYWKGKKVSLLYSLKENELNYSSENSYKEPKSSEY